MTTETKFNIAVAPEADEALDALSEENRDRTLAFIAVELPNVVRRTAVSKATTPFGTIFVFQVPDTGVIVTTLNGRNHDGERVMLAIGVGEVEGLDQ